LNIWISNAIGTQIINIKKHAKNIGEAHRRGNIAKPFGLACLFPSLISNRFDNMLPLVKVVVMFNFIPRLSGSIRVQEKEAFYRLL